MKVHKKLMKLRHTDRENLCFLLTAAKTHSEPSADLLYRVETFERKDSCPQISYELGILAVFFGKSPLGIYCAIIEDAIMQTIRRREKNTVCGFYYDSTIGRLNLDSRGDENGSIDSCFL